MDHSRHMDGHDHPQTFDGVIARGFPLERLQELRKAHEERVQGRFAPSAPKLKRATAAAVVTRKDARSLGFEEQAAFQNAVTRLVEEGRYRALVGDHMNMYHNMHGSMGEIGLYRFLGWHRRYLVEFERELQRVDAILRPSATEKLGIP